MEEYVVLPKPPIQRMDPKTGIVREESTSRTVSIAEGVRRDKNGRKRSDGQKTKLVQSGKTFQTDQDMSRLLEKGAVDHAAPYYGKGETVAKIIGNKYVRMPSLGDEVVDDEIPQIS